MTLLSSISLIPAEGKGSRGLPLTSEKKGNIPSNESLLSGGAFKPLTKTT